jgi:hypothetical protein
MRVPGNLRKHFYTYKIDYFDVTNHALVTPDISACIPRRSYGEIYLKMKVKLYCEKHIAVNTVRPIRSTY